MSVVTSESVRTLLARSSKLSPALLEPEDYVSRGNAHYRLGDYESALEDFERALQLRPGYVNAAFNRAGMLMMLGRLDAAAEAFKTTAELADRQDILVVADAMHYLARVLLERAARADADADDLDPAWDAIQEAMKRSNDAAVLYDAARIQGARGHTSEALDLLTKALAARPAYAVVMKEQAEFASIKDTPGFQNLIESHERQAS